MQESMPFVLQTRHRRMHALENSTVFFNSDAVEASESLRKLIQHVEAFRMTTFGFNFMSYLVFNCVIT